MPALEPVVATLIANTKPYIDGIKEAGLATDEFAAGAESAGVDAGAGLAGGVEQETKKLGSKLEKDGEAAGGNFGNGIRAGLSKLLGVAGGLGIPVKPLQEGLHKAGEAAQEAEKHSTSLFDKFAGVGKVATFGVAAAAAAAAAEGLHLAQSMQTADAQIAVSANISSAAANKIGQAFLNTGGTTEFSAQEMATAYAKVAGQMTAVQGTALTATQATGFMTHAMDLATAKGISLTQATSAISSVLQAFQLKTKDAGQATDILTSSSNMTGLAVNKIAMQLGQVRSRIGGVAPPLGNLAGLLVDLTEHGETGRAAMTALNTTFTSFLKPAMAAAKAQNELRVGTMDLPPQLRTLAAEYLKGNVTSTQVTAATKNLTVTQAALWGQFKKGADASRMAYTEYQKMGIQAIDSKGKLEPLGYIFEQLHNKIKGMGPAQAAATIGALGFGSSAAKILPVIEAGGAAYDKATEQVTKTGAAHVAAGKMAATLGVEFKTIKASVEDLLTKLGQALMPVIKTVIGGFAKLIEFVIKCKPLLIGLGVVVGGFLTAVIGAFAINTIGNMVNSIKTAGESMFNLGKKMLGMGAEAEESAAMVEGAMDGVAATTEVDGEATGFALDSMLGPIGLLIPVIMEVATHWKAIWDGIKKVAETVWHALDAVWNGIKDAVLAAFHYIKNHLKIIIEAIFVVITGPIGLLVLWLFNHWKQVKHDVLTVWNDVLNFFKAIPGKILSIFTGALSWLEHIGSDILTGLWNGIVEGAKAVWFFYVQLPIKILGYLADAATWLVKTGWNLLQGLWHGIVNGAKDVWNWFTSLPGAVLNMLADAGTWLLDVGKKIIQGLWNGLKSAWNDVTGWLGDVGGWITNLKGPPSKDAVLLHENGRLIMRGLGEGLKKGWSDHVAPTLSAMNGAIGTSISTTISGSSVSALGRGLASSSAGGTVLQVTTPIQINGQTLASVVTQYQLRGARVTGNALGRYSGGSQTAAATSINPNAISR